MRVRRRATYFDLYMFWWDYEGQQDRKICISAANKTMIGNSHGHADVITRNIRRSCYSRKQRANTDVPDGSNDDEYALGKGLYS